MKRRSAVILTLSLLAASAGLVMAFAGPSALQYDDGGRMLYPKLYRDWIFLTAGFNMSYSAAAPSANGSGPVVFDNVFAEPEAYRAFQRDGVWPDKTVLVLELRNGETNGSINKRGHFQSSVNHVEAHVKDKSRFAGEWAFFSFDGEKSGTLLPKTASCYSCHEQHAAADTTFVQFYPTLLPIARNKATLSEAYRRESTNAPVK